MTPSLKRHESQNNEPTSGAARTRSFGGCLTCRTRHAKCDETRPTCTTCTKANIVCEGYEIKLTWIFLSKAGNVPKGQADEEESSGCRRLLFTDEERALMSGELVDSLKGVKLQKVFNEIDLKCNGGLRESVTIGPFRTFDIHPPALVSESSDEIIEVVGLDHENDFDLSLAALEDSEWANPMDLLLSATEFDQGLVPYSNIPGLPQDDSAGRSTVVLDIPFSPTGLSGIYDGIPPPLGSPDDSTGVIPPDAFFLLEHYRLKVIHQYSPKTQPVKKTPWQVLHLPSAMNTLGEMTMWQYTNRTKSALFYAILAISAFHLENVSEDEITANHWKQTATNYKEKAMKHLQKALREEVEGPSKAKYKEMLMAILSMVTICVYSGHQTHMRFYLLDAERLIRLRGLAKPRLSRKARLLHHIYGYLRIIAESTFVLHGSCESSPSFTDTSQRASTLINHAFRMRRCSSENAGTMDLHKVKDAASAYHDLHLEDLRRWDQSLFPEVYGMPETVLGLISETTRLANEMEYLKVAPSHDSLLTVERLQERASLLEEIICSWTSEEQSLSSNNFVRAMHSALVIFFYRRIRNLNATMLQTHVALTLQYLAASETERLNPNPKPSSDPNAAPNVINGAAIPWPAFMAACEAISPELQAESEGWLEEQSRKYGYAHFELARGVAREVWRERRVRGSLSYSWVEWCRERGVANLFS